MNRRLEKGRRRRACQGVTGIRNRGLGLPSQRRKDTIESRSCEALSGSRPPWMLVGVPLILTASISLLRRLFLLFVFFVFLSFLFLLLLRPDTWKLVKGSGKKDKNEMRVDRARMVDT